MKNVILITANKDGASVVYNSIAMQIISNALVNQGFSIIKCEGAYIDEDRNGALVEEPVYAVDIEGCPVDAEFLDYFRELILVFDQNHFIWVSDKGNAYKCYHEVGYDEPIGQPVKIKFQREEEAPYTRIQTMVGPVYWRFMTDDELSYEMEEDFENPGGTKQSAYELRMAEDAIKHRTLNLWG